MDNLPMGCRNLSRDQLLSLNRTCQCVSLPPEMNLHYFTGINVDLNTRAGNPSLPDQPRSRRRAGDSANSAMPLATTPTPMQAFPQQLSTVPDNLFARTAVFVTLSELDDMQQQIDAIESVAALPAYRHLISHRNSVSHTGQQADTHGLLMGYDFHLTEKGPRLIEVNTNPGGAFIMHAMLKGIHHRVSPCSGDTLDNPLSIKQYLTDMFIQEWQASGRQGKPATVAIVDSNPQQQFLYADMLLAKVMLEKANIKTVICSPECLTLANGDLYLKKLKIDFVYNRSTDFYLHSPPTSTLRQALKNNSAVVSPAPLHHGLFADKRNPAIWQNKTQMDLCAATDATINTLARLPATEQVITNDAPDLWQRRKQLFFKPNAGFGSKATYRGDKLTRKVWKSIVQGGYIAQALEPPALRMVGEGDDSSLMKFDIRIFTYKGQRILSAARVYQGQTTNFRTPGGGFAPVVYLD